MSNTKEQYGTMDEVIERFKEVIATAKPGQHVEFNFRVPVPVKNNVRMHLYSGQKAADITKLINEALESYKLKEPGYVAMDENGLWCYYPVVPIAEVDEGFFTSDGEFYNLFQIDPRDFQIDWTKTIRYVY